jgi:DNA mismatch repair protein MutL
MARTIQILPDAVANQIAAGEVVERPASVVKELVENALDAGAGRVEVILRGGGKREIRVADDGHGMSREDAVLAMDRHATSKIRSADDLRGIRSFGFRGEALPSIASVSYLAIETRVRGAPVGTRIRSRAGTVTVFEEISRTVGTTVLVERLFFNTPARAQFLRATGAETRAVQEALLPLALLNPAVTFQLLSDDRVLLDLPAVRSVLDRVAGIWGDDAASQLLPLGDQGGGGEAPMRIWGLIQRPDQARPGFRRAHLFANGRPFRDAGVLRAADRGYRTTIPEGHRPWVFLFLEVPKGSLDVNVHPTKAEVRFQDRAAVERLVEAGVREALEGEASMATLDHPQITRERQGSYPATAATGAGAHAAAGTGSGTADPANPIPPGLPGPQTGRSGSPAAPRPVAASTGQTSLFMPLPPLPIDASGSGAVGTEGGRAVDADDDGITTLEETVGAAEPRLWQVHQRWILAEVRDGVLLIDQHAAHERILFEAIMDRFDEGGTPGQRLLFPLTFRLTPPEVQMVEDLKGLLLRAGYEAEPFGRDTVIVHAVPNPHPHFDAEGCFREMIDELTHGSELLRSARNQHERLAMSFACKAAIKAGQPLDSREIQELFDQLFATRLPYHDVHGRPTTVRLSRTELERKFGR